MAKIIAKKFEIIGYPRGSADHLLYEFFDNVGNLIAQVNGMAYDDGQLQMYTKSLDLNSLLSEGH